MNKLSAVIITKNEGKRISTCIKSLLSFVDEIVIVDDKSSDKTVEICKELGAKVTINESGGNFDRQRNIGIEKASCQWILQMDADEIVFPQIALKIKETIENPSDYVAFELRRKKFFFGYSLRWRCCKIALFVILRTKSL